jgi:hypothetical protein
VKSRQFKYKRQGRKNQFPYLSRSLDRRESLRRAALSTSRITITENNAIPPYQRLARSIIDGREYSVTDGTECLRLYSVLLEKSDLNCSTASLSLLECQRVSAPTVRVAVNSKIKILYRFGISQVHSELAKVELKYFTPKSIDCQRNPPPVLRSCGWRGDAPLSCLLPLMQIFFCRTERLPETPRITWENEPRR